MFRALIAKLTSLRDRTVILFNWICGLQFWIYFPTIAVQIYRTIYQFVRLLQSLAYALQPWGVVLASVSLIVTVMGFAVEMEDRQSERIFRAWQVVLQATRDTIPDEVSGTPRSSNSDGEPLNYSPTSIREALEYLNRSFPGRICDDSLKTTICLLYWQR